MGWGGGGGGAGAGVLGAARGAGAERGPWGRRDDRLPPPAGASWKGPVGPRCPRRPRAACGIWVGSVAVDLGVLRSGPGHSANREFRALGPSRPTAPRVLGPELPPETCPGHLGLGASRGACCSVGWVSL